MLFIVSYDGTKRELTRASAGLGISSFIQQFSKSVVYRCTLENLARRLDIGS